MKSKKIKEFKEFKEGDKLLYTGRGFIGFDTNDTIMFFVKKDGYDFRVRYKNRQMLVRDYEVKKY